MKAVEGMAVDVGHRDIVRAVDLSHVVHGANVGMVQIRRRPSFAVKAFEQFGRGLLLEVGRLEGDLPLQLRVFGEIDHAHRALAQRPDDAVATELRFEPAPFARTPHGLRGDRLQAVPGERLRRRDGDVDAIAGRFGRGGRPLWAAGVV